MHVPYTNHKNEKYKKHIFMISVNLSSAQGLDFFQLSNYNRPTTLFRAISGQVFGRSDFRPTEQLFALNIFTHRWHYLGLGDKSKQTSAAQCLTCFDGWVLSFWFCLTFSYRLKYILWIFLKVDLMTIYFLMKRQKGLSVPKRLHLGVHQCVNQKYEVIIYLFHWLFHYWTIISFYHAVVFWSNKNWGIR